MTLHSLLADLLARIPELEWQLNKVGDVFSAKSLPRGLFKHHYDASSADYIAEIRADINRLKTHVNGRAARYLAEKINEKINVLVTLCSQYNRQTSVREVARFTVDQLSTRQQWLNQLEQTIQRLSAQQQALVKALSQQTASDDPLVQLNLRRELGELEKQLTQAQEMYAARE